MFVLLSTLTLVLKQFQFPIVTKVLTDPLAQRSRLTLLHYTLRRTRAWSSRQSGADLCRRLDEMVQGLVMPLNRLSWLVPLTTQALTAGLSAVMYDGGGRDLLVAVGVVVVVQLTEVRRTSARASSRKLANDAARPYLDLRTLEMRRLPGSLQSGRARGAALARRVQAYDEVARSSKLPVHWRAAAESAALGVVKRAAVFCVVYAGGGEPKDMLVKIMLMERFVSSSSVVMQHFTVEMPREVERFGKNGRELFEGVREGREGGGKDLPEGEFKIEVERLEVTLPGIRFGVGEGEPVELRSGAVHVLRGENGSGKTTFLRLLSGELQDRGPPLSYSMRCGGDTLAYDSVEAGDNGEADVFASAYERDLVAAVPQDSGEQLKAQTLGDVFFRFNDFCDPRSPAGGDEAYRFVGGDGAVELQLRTWLMDVLSYVLSIASAVGGQGAGRARGPGFWAKSLTDGMRERLLSELTVAGGGLSPVAARVVLLDEPDREIDERSVKHVLRGLWASVADETMLMLMITHTNIPAWDDNGDSAEEAGAPSDRITLAKLQEKIGQKSGGELQRIRLASFFFRQIVLRALLGMGGSEGRIPELRHLHVKVEKGGEQGKNGERRSVLRSGPQKE